MDAVGAGAGGDGGLDVRGQVVEDLEGQVAELLAGAVGALDLLARVRFQELEAQVAAEDFQGGGGLFFLREAVGVGGGGAGKGGEVGDERGQVVVVGVGFEAEAALEGNGEGGDEVEGGEFGEEVGLAEIRARGVAFVGVDPDVAGQVAGGLDELGPVLAAFDVAFVGAGGAEGDAEADDEAQDGEEKVRHDERVPELRDACDDGGPDGDEDEGDDHPGCDAASHAEEVGHFAMLFNVEGFGDEVVDGAGVAAGGRAETLVWRGGGLAERG